MEIVIGIILSRVLGVIRAYYVDSFFHCRVATPKPFEHLWKAWP